VSERRHESSGLKSGQ